MTGKHPFPTILLFGQGTVILPSRLISASPARTAKVKGGAVQAARPGALYP
ncbi:hypothetical protein Apmu_0130_06 [Acidiphilium multivorum AIU301]|uniref:hypothetical protein n=1 Tax=Acidiphilium multivorum TaxID=62140 RepID=UPI00030C6A29|nr:hypothetical protein [Acidiphilium multivorum]GAN73981.1 hypothetical protein Apmu_0130_06 [Acidiphilium multivorum AIU301]